MDEQAIREVLDSAGQLHVLRYWDELTGDEKEHLTGQIELIDFALVQRLVQNWVIDEPSMETFERIEPVSVIPPIDPAREDAIEAFAAGEEALRQGRVGILLVAGGQGTRLGYDGPKGTYPIGPLSGRSLFDFHAARILNLQRRFACTLPWYIMVGETNEAATTAFFEERDYFGLGRENVLFFKQQMMPSVDEKGLLILESKSSIAMNPNGHGGCIPALVENGIIDDAKGRSIDTLSYFQVDNWAARSADPYFIGYHLLRDGEMSSKVKRKAKARESMGVFCCCDGKVRVIEYTELDIYPDLLQVDDAGGPIHFAANAATHVLSVDFIERTYLGFKDFPWHCSRKKISGLNAAGECVVPDAPNGYKFETFIFDALPGVKSNPVLLEIDPMGEYAPTKQLKGPDSVEAARTQMTRYWGGWLRAAACTTPLNGDDVEISPEFALTCGEFVEKAQGLAWPESGPVAIGPGGDFE